MCIRSRFGPIQSWMIRPTFLTRRAMQVAGGVILGTAAFLWMSYGSLPWLLPVHFKPNGRPNGWQYKTLGRVMMPVGVQMVLALTLGGIGALLLSRRDRSREANTPDAKTAAIAAETVALIALIWVAFQGYAAITLVRMWRTGQPGLGAGYPLVAAVGLLLTVIVGIQAQIRLGRPQPGRDIPGHWRLGHLYCNAENPALFVPTRNGSHWTLNFGRPAAVALLGAILAAGVAMPTAILILALRY